MHSVRLKYLHYLTSLFLTLPLILYFCIFITPASTSPSLPPISSFHSLPQLIDNLTLIYKTYLFDHIHENNYIERIQVIETTTQNSTLSPSAENTHEEPNSIPTVPVGNDSGEINQIVESDKEALEGEKVNATIEEKKLITINICPDADDPPPVETLHGDGEETETVQVPEWLRAPLSDDKIRDIENSYELPLFNYSIRRVFPQCRNPKGLQSWNATLETEDREETYCDEKSKKEEERDLALLFTHWKNYFLPQGYLKTHNFHYAPQHYCIRKMSEDDLSIAYCPPQEEIDAVINKCCPMGFVLSTNPANFHLTQCVETGKDEWEPIFEQDNAEETEIIYPYYHHKQLDCQWDLEGLIPNEHLPISGKNIADLRVLKTGEVLSRFTGNSKWDKPKTNHKEYVGVHCIDGFLAHPHSYPSQPQNESGSGVIFPEVGDNSSEVLSCKNTTTLISTSLPMTVTRLTLTANTTTSIDSGEISENENDLVLDVVNLNETAEAEYAMDKERNFTEMETVFMPMHQHQIVIFCPNNVELEKNQQLFAQIYFALFCLATPFHLITFTVYAMVAPKQNVHGWTTAGFSFAALSYYVTIAIGQFAIAFQESEILPFRSQACVIIAILNQFGYIAMFAWMTVLNFDLWLTISSMVPMMGRSKGLKRFIGYCIFGFGVPSVCVSISITLEKNFGLFDGRVNRPEYGRVGCTVDETGYLCHKLLPTAILFSFNLVFIVLTFLSLYKFKKDTIRVSKSNSKSSRSHARLFAKLFVLMGLTWSSEIVSWFFEGHGNWFWACFDIINILQPIALFWIFVCKKEIKDHLCQSYACIQSIWNVLDKKKSKKKLAPSSSVAGTSSQGDTHSVSVSRLQSVRMRSIK